MNEVLDAVSEKLAASEHSLVVARAALSAFLASMRGMTIVPAGRPGHCWLCACILEGEGERFRNLVVCGVCFGRLHLLERGCTP